MLEEGTLVCGGASPRSPFATPRHALIREFMVETAGMFEECSSAPESSTGDSASEPEMRYSVSAGSQSHRSFLEAFPRVWAGARCGVAVPLDREAPPFPNVIGDSANPAESPQSWPKPPEFGRGQPTSHRDRPRSGRSQPNLGGPPSKGGTSNLATPTDVSNFRGCWKG